MTQRKKGIVKTIQCHVNLLCLTDLSEGVYLPQNSSSCSRLCPKLDISKSSPDVVAKMSACCDSKAVCSCGTHTGHFACICPPGHFGRGLMGDCNRELSEFQMGVNWREYKTRVLFW